MSKSPESVPRIRLVAAVRRQLDCEAWTALFLQRHDFHLVAAETELAKAAAACQERRPDAILMDASFPNAEAFVTAEELVANKAVDVAMFIDEDVHMTRVRNAIKSKSFGYLTKNQGFDDICHGILDLLVGRMTSDALLYHRAHGEVGGKRPLDDVLRQGVLGLSERELAVMRLLAMGDTIQEVASKLDLSSSTIHSDKVRILKQLQADNTAHITRIAMREGLID